MRIIKATIPMLESRTLVIGFQAENQRTQVRIDCAPILAEYPYATPSLAIKPPSGETYPVFVDRDGDEVVWTILSGNLALVGDGELQLTFVKDSVIAKTVIGHIRILRSLVVSGEMPDPVAQWIDDANAKLHEVDAQIVELEGMVDTATDAATRAEQSASTASTRAEQAAESAATATAKATEATTAATTATAKAAEAQTAANAAAESEQIATTKAAEASQFAQVAGTKAAEAAESARTASTKAGEANDAAERAEQSASNAGYMYMEIVDGHLIFNRTANVSVIDFALVDGHLIVEVA